MEYVTGIVVKSKYRAIGIPAIPNIPFLHLTAGRIHTELVESSASLGQQALNSRREEEPVGVRRVDLTHILELFDISLFRYLVERFPQNVPSSQERLCDVGRINQILTCDTPTEIVG